MMCTDCGRRLMRAGDEDLGTCGECQQAASRVCDRMIADRRATTRSTLGRRATDLAFARAASDAVDDPHSSTPSAGAVRGAAPVGVTEPPHPYALGDPTLAERAGAAL